MNPAHQKPIDGSGSVRSELPVVKPAATVTKAPLNRIPVDPFRQAAREALDQFMIPDLVGIVLDSIGPPAVEQALAAAEACDPGDLVVNALATQQAGGTPWLEFAKHRGFLHVAMDHQEWANEINSSISDAKGEYPDEGEKLQRAMEELGVTRPPGKVSDPRALISQARATASASPDGGDAERGTEALLILRFRTGRDPIDGLARFADDVLHAIDDADDHGDGQHWFNAIVNYMQAGGRMIDVDGVILPECLLKAACDSGEHAAALGTLVDVLDRQAWLSTSVSFPWQCRAQLIARLIDLQDSLQGLPESPEISQLTRDLEAMLAPFSFDDPAGLDEADLALEKAPGRAIALLKLLDKAVKSIESNQDSIERGVLRHVPEVFRQLHADLTLLARADDAYMTASSPGGAPVRDAKSSGSRDGDDSDRDGEGVDDEGGDGGEAADLSLPFNPGGGAGVA